LFCFTFQTYFPLPSQTNHTIHAGREILFDVCILLSNQTRQLTILTFRQKKLHGQTTFCRLGPDYLKTLQATQDTTQQPIAFNCSGM